MEFETFESEIVFGSEVRWPERCRNCQGIYPGELKSEVTRLVKTSDVTLLKAVSSTLLKNGITKYCCLNNFKPQCEKRYIPNIVREIFVEISPQVYVDKTMSDWLDIKWDCDDIVPEEVKVVKNTISGEISLFDL
jgi:hypothetical protein